MSLKHADARRSEERFRLLFNNAFDAVFVCHLDSDSRFSNFIEVNEQACKRLRYSRDELLNLSPYDIIDPADTELIHIAVAQLTAQKYTILEISFRTRNKRRIPVEISSHLFEYNQLPTVLWIARDITERKRSEDRLKTSREQLRNLASRIQRIREEERSMLAREIHDELGQALTALKIQVSLFANKLNEDQHELRSRAESVQDMIDQTVDALQRILAKLRPGILDELGLVPAIEWQTQDFQRVTGISCDCMLPEDHLELDEEKSTAVFRIFQEALTNIARHANADHVTVTLKIEKNLMILEVTDNGEGITESQINDTRSLGLLGMRERTFLLGGQFEINGVRGSGTNVKVEVPLDAAPGKNKGTAVNP